MTASREKAAAWIKANAERLRNAGPWKLTRPTMPGCDRQLRTETDCCPLSVAESAPAHNDIQTLAAANDISVATAACIVDAADGLHPGTVRGLLLDTLEVTA